MMTTIGFSYPAALARTGRTVLVRFRDLPEALTEGATISEALREAEDCVEEAIAGRLRRGDDIPAPSRPRRGERLIPVPAVTATKAALALALRETNMSQTELARRLHTTKEEVHRMIDPRNPSKLGKLQEAMAVLGRRYVVGVQAA